MMNFYSTVIQDINKLQSSIDEINNESLFANKTRFIDSLEKLEETIKTIKDKCNEENNI